VEGRIFAAGGHARRPPYADLNLGKDLLELPLGLTHGPALSVGPERDHLALAVGPDSEAECGKPVLAIVRPNLTL